MSTVTGSTTTRRALLGAAIGGAAAVAAGSVPQVARAATGDGVLLGKGSVAGENEAGAVTKITNTGAGGDGGLEAMGSGGGPGVTGVSTAGSGVVGRCADTTPSSFESGSYKVGVRGTSGDDADMADNQDETGVYGFSSMSASSNGVWGDSLDATGVYGTGYWGIYAQGAIAVQGDAGTFGVGVYGWTGAGTPPEPPAGVAVLARAESLSQTALQVVGKVKFDRSGKLTMSTSSKKFTKSGVTSSSLVLVTLRTSVSGLYVKAVTPTTGAFTVYLSKSPGKTVAFSYLIING
jgi:hypothetical protein